MSINNYLSNLFQNKSKRQKNLTKDIYDALLSSTNALWYSLSKRHILEGHYCSKTNTYKTWDHSFITQPKRFLTPSTEAEFRSIILESKQLSFIGAGHTFNDDHLTDQVLVSLDCYQGLIELDEKNGRATFKAGTRMRDVANMLAEKGLAFPVLPDHNAQSIAGILATDVHASGNPGYVSEAVTKIRLMDGRGEIHEADRGSQLFKAIIGGLGATGVILSVSFQFVPEFSLETRAFSCSFETFMDNIEHWWQTYDLLGAAYLGAADCFVVEVKSKTNKPMTPLGAGIENFRHISEAISQALVLPLTAYFGQVGKRLGGGLMNVLSASTRLYPALVLPSSEGFNRNVYHMHREVEFTCSWETGRSIFYQAREMYRKRPNNRYYMVGIRKTQCNPETLIGAGAGDKATEIVWMAPHAIGSLTDPEEDEKWRKIIIEAQAKMHYGKHLMGFKPDYLKQVHGERWDTFVKILKQHDPEKKFFNRMLPEY